MFVTNPMQVSISVVICTHNPRPEYLRRTLGALQNQTLPLEKWELLIIDNASRDRLENTWDISWHPGGRHVREDTVGLTPARLTGIRESRGSLLVFVDDDNVLAPNYLELASAILGQHPFLGAFGSGALEPEFEVPIPQELQSRLDTLAVRTVRSILWSNNIEDYRCFPWGAGLCVTRQVVTRYIQLIEQFNATGVIDRQGKRLFSGGDDIFSWAAVAVGRGFGIFPELRITHLISADRLTQSYFLRWCRDHSYSHGVLMYLRKGMRPEHVGLTGYARILLHGFRHGIFSARCLWEVEQGRASAAHFIVQANLSPINIENLS
jgi:glycosyltransferase involved in cell wall biosynthesis